MQVKEVNLATQINVTQQLTVDNGDKDKTFKCFYFVAVIIRAKT